MADGAIPFNNIPGSGLVAPLFAFEANSGGQYSSQARIVLIGHATGAGNLPALNPKLCVTQDRADSFSGPGSMLREMYRLARLNAPALPIYMVRMPAVGVPEVRTITFANLGAAVGTGTLQIEGERFSVTVSATDTNVTVAAAVAAAINSYYNTLTKAMLPLTATSSGAVVTTTMRHPGAIMSDVDISVPTDDASNVFLGMGVYTEAVTTPGSGVPDVGSALAALGDDPANFVICPWADSASLAAYSAWANDVSGRWSWNSQTYGHVWACLTASVANATTAGLAVSDRHYTMLLRPPTGANASWLWISGYCAAQATWLADCVTGNVSRNQSGRVILGLTPPLLRAHWYGYQIRNTLLQSGISTYRIDAVGNVCVDKCITTYRLGLSGQPDSVFRDIQSMYQLSGGLSYMRAVLATEQGQKAFATENPGSLDALSTPADITSSFLHAYKTLCKNGVFQNFGSFSQGVRCLADTDNPARANVFAPMVRVNPLDIIAANATIYSRAPDVAPTFAQAA